MEEFARSIRSFFSGVSSWLSPYLRQFLRFLALPWCYFFRVNWTDCPASRWKVIKDFAYIFFVLKYFPDNYSNCRLFDKPREDWTWYYGSGYNPFQKAKLIKKLQPTKFQVLFENKEICQQLCSGLGFPVPTFFGVLDPDISFSNQVHSIMGRARVEELIAKPISGSAGSGIIKILDSPNGLVIKVRSGQRNLDNIEIKERYIVQEVVKQHGEVSAIYSNAANSIRMLTLFKKTGSVVISSAMRFGVGLAFVDNWSAGGVAVGVNSETGQMADLAFDKFGRMYKCHPDSKIYFGGLKLPMWDKLMTLACHVQDAFPYYGMLGLDMVVEETGPVLIEINAFPDLVFQEQTAGPLLKNPDCYREFESHDLFINNKQKRLHVPKIE